MKEVVETLHKSAVELDQRILGENRVKVVAALGIANFALTMAGLGATQHLESREESHTTNAIEIEYTQDKFAMGLLGTTPVPVKKPVHVAPKPKLHKTIKPTTIHTPFKWSQVRLADDPEAIPGDPFVRLAELIDEIPKSQALTDISHPQCEDIGVSEAKAANKAGVVDEEVNPRVENGLKKVPLAIIGVNGGRLFTTNRCLKEMAEMTENYDFYLNAANPGFNAMRRAVKNRTNCHLNNRLCVAEAYGGLAADFSLKKIKAAGLHAPHNYFWIDVEKPKAMWGVDEHGHGPGAENRAILQGMIKVLRGANPNPRIGFYSAPQSIVHPDRRSQWAQITGTQSEPQGWKNNYDAWIATGSGPKREAIGACYNRDSFTGGRIVLSQHSKKINGVTVDANVLCPPDSQ